MLPHWHKIDTSQNYTRSCSAALPPTYVVGKYLDVNGTGFVSYDAFSKFMLEHIDPHMPRLQVAAYWTAIDEDRIGHVTMGEFCRRALLVAW